MCSPKNQGLGRANKKMETPHHEYMREWQVESYQVPYKLDRPFYTKWAQLIESITGVSPTRCEGGLQLYGLASTCAMIITQRFNIQIDYSA